MWRREALDSIGGIQYGSITEDKWTGHLAHEAGWTSSYLRKDYISDQTRPFRLAEGATPPSVAAALAQRKRWHKGAVEIALGVENAHDPQWCPPAARVPRPDAIPRHVHRFRCLQWWYIRLSWLATTFPPLFLTVIVCASPWMQSIWLYLNPLPAGAIMVPKLLLSSLVPAILDLSSLDA